MRMERKVVAGGSIGLPLAVILTWAWNSANPENQMPAEVSAAVGSLLTWIISYLVPNPK